MNYLLLLLTGLIVCAGALPLLAEPPQAAAADRGAKYVFFFLGDGMAAAQVHAAWAYRTALNGGNPGRPEELLAPSNRLHMTRLPVQGMATTFNEGALITDSAAAATAFACGAKTKSGVIGKSADAKLDYKSVARLAHEKGKSVGILTSVSLDHATPAAYYACAASRSEMNRIGMQLADSGFEFFGGGGLAKPLGPDGDVWARLKQNGYTVISNRTAILNAPDAPDGKLVCINPWLQDKAAMPYAVDRAQQPEGVQNLSLKEMTEVAIRRLEKDPEGFFMMVEGGKIDWACHANDAVAALGDLLDFDDAVGAAVAFASEHAAETLLVVTGDHETGGMSVGNTTTAYTARFERLAGQRSSSVQFIAGAWAEHRKAFKQTYDRAKNNLASGDPDATAFTNLLATTFGLDYKALNPFEKKRLEAAYDQSMAGQNGNLTEENARIYGTYEPVVVTVTHLLNERACIGWTTFSHTGVPVPVYATGFEADRFGGFYDNTDLAKRVAAAMRVSAPLPVVQ